MKSHRYSSSIRKLTGGILAFGVFASGCAPQNASRVAEQSRDNIPFKVETVASGLVVPWALAFTPDGRILITERPGRVRVVDHGSLKKAPWATLDVDSSGEDGLMGITLSPDFQKTGLVYVVGTFKAGDRLVNRVIRFIDRNGFGVEPLVVIDNIPAAPLHAGDAITFGPDGMLYVATGDVREPKAAQDPKLLSGKILRYRPDGTIPSDNPFPGSPVYALGLRNVQGLSWHPQSHELFVTEHGPSGFRNESFRRDRDEFNVIRPGANYGWPIVSGMEKDPRFTPPLVEWTPAIAPSGLAFYTGSEFPWRGNAFIGGLRGEQLLRLLLERASGTRNGWRVVAEEPLFKGELGRIRAVAMGPDGHLYFTTSNRDGRGRPGPEDDRVFRIVHR